MGAFIGKVLAVIFGKKECGILMVGLDGAGKTTTFLYKLKLGEIVTTMPDIGFCVESVKYKNVTFTALGMILIYYPRFDHHHVNYFNTLDLHPLWPRLVNHYSQNTLGIIFVVDSNDRETIDDGPDGFTSARDELHSLLENVELRDAVLLVYANKQDLPNSMSVNEVTERLGLNTLRNRQWYIQPTCATTGDGLYEGLERISIFCSP